MPCTYVLVRSREGLEDARRRIELAQRYLPVVPSRSQRHENADGSLLVVWCTCREAEGDGCLHVSASGAVAYNGWVAGVGPSSPAREAPGAARIAGVLDAQGIDRFAERAQGEWSVLSLGPDGAIQAATDFLGGEHVYYGDAAGVVAVSNRAFPCAVALHGGLPAPDPFFLGWLLTRNRAFVSDDETAFAGVRALHPRTVLCAPARAETLEPRPKRREDTRPRSWDELTAELVDRVRVVERRPDVSFWLTLTGGRDSRLILAALVASGAVRAIAGCTLVGGPGQPDAVVARRLAEHHGLRFRCTPPDLDRSDLWDALALHTFQSEMGVHFWNGKGAQSRSREGRIGGNYGEIYWSHAFLRQALGWRGVARIFESSDNIDPHGIFTDEARRYYHDRMGRFWRRRRDEGLSPLEVRDRWHRDVRKWRWVGQTRLADASASLNVNPLPSLRLLDKYLTLSLLDQRYGRVHYELMRRLDPWLTRQPFAGPGWPPYLTGRLPQRPVPPATSAKSALAPQRAAFQRERRAIRQYLLQPDAGGFFQVVDRRRLEALLDRVTEGSPQDDMNAVFGSIGIRHALRAPLEPRPCSIA
jgi:hypothetical protein